MAGTGIDVSSRQTIAVEVVKAGHSYRLVRSAILAGFDHDPTKPAADASKSGLAQGIREVPGALRKSAAVALPGKDVIYRTTEIGADNYYALRTLARMEAEEVRGAGSAVLWAQQVVESPGAGRMLLVGVTREEMAEHYASSLQHAGIGVASLVPAPVALYHCFLMSGQVDAPGTTMIVNIGEATSEVCLVNDGGLVAVRSISLGVSQFVTSLALALGTNQEQARATLFTRIDMRPGHAGVNVSGERAVTSAQETAAQMLQQLMGTISYARMASKSRNLDVDRVVLCGPGAGIKGLPEYLATRMRKPFEMLNPLSGFDTKDLDDASMAAVSQFGPSLAIPLGLAKVAADDNIGDLKIVPPSVLARIHFLTRSLWLYAGVLLLVAVLAYSLIFSMDASSIATKTLSDAQAAKAAYDTHSREVRPYRSTNPRETPTQNLRNQPQLWADLVMSEQRLVEISEARRPSLDGTAVMAWLLERLIPEVTLISAEMAPLLGAEGMTPPALEVTVFISKQTREVPAIFIELQNLLRSNPRVADVTVGKMLAETDDGTGSTGSLRVTFTDTDSILRAPRKEGGGT